MDVLLGDAEKANIKLGWRAKTNISEIAKIMAEYDYNMIKKTI